MIPDSAVVDLIAASYGYAFHWDHWIFGDEADDIKVGIKNYDDFQAIIFPGSVTTEDWLRDAISGTPLNHPILGTVPLGFNLGVDKAAELISPMLTKPLVFGGHSLGAARAQQVAGLLSASTPHIISKIVVCGSPRPGCAHLAQMLAKYPISNYRNGFDIVTFLPEPWLGFNVCQMRQQIQLNERPQTGDSSPLAWHHIPLYQSGVKLLEAQV